MSNPFSEIAELHGQITSLRDRLYAALARCQWTDAGELVESLRAAHGRYVGCLRAAAENARAFHAASPHRSFRGSKALAHVAAVAESGDAERLEEVAVRLARGVMEAGQTEENEE